MLFLPKTDDEGKNSQTVLTKPGFEGITGLGNITEGNVTYGSAIKSSGEEQSIGNLPDGKYRLVERVAPAGYIIEKPEWSFEIRGGVITSRDEGMGTGMAIVIENTPAQPSRTPAAPAPR